MQKFVQMMGGMESTAKTAKGQMNDYKSTIEQLTMQYNRMTEAQKKVIGQDYPKTLFPYTGTITKTTSTLMKR